MFALSLGAVLLLAQPQPPVTPDWQTVYERSGYTVVAPIAQVGAKLRMQLLEPDAPDALAHWGLFNAVFEQKEYFESYAMEPIARKMLEADPKLKADFEERLKDPGFAADPRARLQYFFERSPYFDAYLNRYPVVRLTAEQLNSVQSSK